MWRNVIYVAYIWSERDAGWFHDGRNALFKQTAFGEYKKMNLERYDLK